MKVRATDLVKQVGVHQPGASTASRDGTHTSRIRFGQDAIRFLTDTETENDDRAESDDASMNGDRPDSDLESASDSERLLSARLETLNDTSDSIARRRTRHGSEPAGATHANAKYPDEIEKANAAKSSDTNASTVPKSHAISVTKLGGVLQLTDTAGMNGSSLYNEITRELAKQNDLVSAMLADQVTGARRVGPVESVTKMDASDWSAVTSLSELESEDDLRPSMNSTHLTQSRSVAAPAPVYANVNVNVSKPAQQNYDSAALPSKPALQEAPKRIAQLPQPAPQLQPVLQSCDSSIQRDPDSASQISRSIRSQIEELLAIADQQDEIIKQASAALARCKQIQRRIASGQYGSVSRGTNNADSYSSALPIQEFVEANRVLLIACQRRQACLAEVELFKTKTLNDASFDPLAGRRGSLIIDGLRFGLKREFLERYGAFASEVHYVIVTLRLGSHVFVSQMINTEHDVDLRTRCIDVPNKFQLEITPAFTMRLQVFCLTTAKELGVVPRSASNRTSTLTDLIPGACMSGNAKKSKHCYDDSVTSSGSGSSRHGNSTLHYATPSKASRNNKEKKKKSVNESPSWSMAASSFSEVGSLELTMRSVTHSTFMMERVPPLLCPLDGSVHMRLALQMESGIELRGFLTMFEDVAGIGSWHRRWFLLKNDLIRFWKYPDDEFRKEPLGVIRLDQCVNEAVQPVSREKCALPNTFELLILVRQIQPLTAPATSVRSKPQMLVYSYLLSADIKEDRTVWCEKLNANVAFLRTWFADRMPKPFKHPTTQI